MRTILTCEICNCIIQRTPNGTDADGMAAHYRTVHPGTEVQAEPHPWFES